MRARGAIVLYSSDPEAVPPVVAKWVGGLDLPLDTVTSAAEVELMALRALPRAVVVQAAGVDEDRIGLCHRLKRDLLSAVVPIAVLLPDHDTAAVNAYFEAGADEVITPRFEMEEQGYRLATMLLRTERGVSVHPSTGLPGTTEIEREIRTRLEVEEVFGVCYADLDYFKEFNDRYGYYHGDRVIYLLSRILHDSVRGSLGENGFVGHIGGDDFIVIVPFAAISDVCKEILDVFDTLIPYQYNEQDRRAGYYFGKDRRGQLHQVPLMTLSIGIVTNQHRHFTHPAQVSELATEMKSYAKTLPGSVFVVDRRRDPSEEEEDSA